MTDYLKEEMDARGWNQADLANIIGRSQRDVHMLVSGKVPLKPEMATLLGDAFGTGPEYWMNLETAYRAWLTSRDTRDAVSRRARLYQIAPVREMQKRGWIHDTKDVSLLEKEVITFFAVDRLDVLDRNHVAFAARTAAGYRDVTPAQKAWAMRVRNLARAVTVRKAFSNTTLRDCLARLRLLLAHAEEARRVPRILADHGIRFLVVEQLPQTKLDGACLWLDDASPVIALTMRYDRLDWFWFTLMHEIGHVKERDGRNGEVLDASLVGQDATSREDKPDCEKAADAFAEDFLVARADLDNFIARVGPLYSKERIRLFAKRLQVHPALVVGQLQFRGEIEYSHHRDMLKDRVRETLTSNALTDGWGYAPIRV